MDKKYFSLLLAASLSTTSSYAVTNWLFSLMADTMIIASLVSDKHKKSSLVKKIKPYYNVPPKMAYIVSNDMEKAHVHSSVLMPIGIGVAAVSRLRMISKNGFMRTVTSIPMNVCCIGGLYGLRLYEATENPGSFGRVADKARSLLKKQ
jgi:hypothetical protein